MPISESSSLANTHLNVGGSEAKHTQAGGSRCLWFQLHHVGCDDIFPKSTGIRQAAQPRGNDGAPTSNTDGSSRESTNRSEERRVGKECRSRWSAYHEKKTT